MPNLDTIGEVRFKKDGTPRRGKGGLLPDQSTAKPLIDRRIRSLTAKGCKPFYKRVAPHLWMHPSWVISTWHSSPAMTS